MKKKANLLILDDEPMVCKAYQMFLQNDLEFDFHFTIGHNCEKGYELIKKNKECDFDLTILDIQMPASEKYGMCSGEDIGFLLREEYPNTKILILTYLSDRCRLLKLFRHVNPDGVLVKSQINEAFLIKAVNKILKGRTAYCYHFQDIIRKQYAQHDPFLDLLDLELLGLLAEGMPPKEISRSMCLSQSTVDKRKQKLKEFFLDNDDDWSNERRLLHIARKKGYI